MAELDPIERALEELLRLSASRKVHARQAAAAGLTVSQPGFVLLRRIAEGGPIALGELAGLTDMDPAATGRQVRMLERDGLVERTQSTRDARVTEVRVTPRGRQVHRRWRTVVRAHLADVLEAWPARDRDAFARLLARFVDDLRTVRYRSVAETSAG